MAHSAHCEKAHLLRLHDTQSSILGKLWTSVAGKDDGSKGILAASDCLAVERRTDVTLRDEPCDEVRCDDASLGLHNTHTSDS